jgi:dephospho-CoA kinase
MVIGITGVVGSGKSTIVNYIGKTYNCYLIDTDTVAKKLMEPGNIVYEDVVKYFGKEILKEDNTINRNILANIVFNDKEKLKALNNITHNKVINEVKEIIKTHNNQLIIIESALLFDTELKDLCDSCWAIITSDEERKKRLIINRKYTEEKVEQIMKSQKTNEEFIKLADVCIENDNFEEAKKKIKKFLKNYLTNLK